MTQRFTTIEEVKAAINNYNVLLGYPDGKGTDTYCLLPEITEVKDEEDIVIESYYELPVNWELAVKLGLNEENEAE